MVEGHLADLAMRQGGEPLREAEVVEEPQGRRMNGVASEVATEIGVLFQHGDVYPGTGQQQPQHHSGGTAADDRARGCLTHRNTSITVALPVGFGRFAARQTVTNRRCAARDGPVRPAGTDLRNLVGGAEDVCCARRARQVRYHRLRLVTFSDPSALAADRRGAMLSKDTVGRTASGTSNSVLCQPLKELWYDSCCAIIDYR